MNDRMIPQIPPTGEVMRILIDSDVATEIDDLYALTIAFGHPERFLIEGIVAAHFSGNGPSNSKKMSFELLKELLQKSGMEGKFPIAEGSHPMQYANTPNDSEGVDLIIRKAMESTPEDPLWVIGIGAATDLACALLKAPDIVSRVRYVFHARSEHTWPDRNEQFNVYGDIIAAQTLLESEVPLIWFDTGTHICASYEETEEKLAPMGDYGKFLHEFRDRDAWFCQSDKGFFDMGDFSFLYQPDWGLYETVETPEMTRFMYFKHTHRHGKMMRVYDIDVKKTWDLFDEAVNNLRKGV